MRKVSTERQGRHRDFPKEKGKLPGSLRSTTAEIAAKTLATTVHLPDRLSVPNPNRGATQKFLGWPSQMMSYPAKRDTTKYCEFHKDHGHRTDDCIQLRKEIEYLIRQGHLRCYIAPKDCNQAPPPPPRQSAPAQHQQPLGEINVISRGFASGGESSSARKAHLRSIRSGETLELQAVSKYPRLDTTITFLNYNMEGCQHPIMTP